MRPKCGTLETSACVSRSLQQRLEFPVTLDKRIDVRACRHDAESFGPRVFERDPHELLRNAAAALLRRDERVGHDHVSAAKLIIGDRKPAVDFSLESILGSVVPHYHFNRTRVHAAPSCIYRTRQTSGRIGRRWKNRENWKTVEEGLPVLPILPLSPDSSLVFHYLPVLPLSSSSSRFPQRCASTPHTI